MNQVYVLSDTNRLYKFSNIPSIMHRNHANHYILPVSKSRSHITYIKEVSKHPYHIVKVDIEDLKKHVSANTKVAVITNVFCSLDDKKEYIHYDIADFEEGDVGAGDGAT